MTFDAVVTFDIALAAAFIAAMVWQAARENQEEAMSRLRESEKLVEDLKNAMRAVGKALIDTSVPVPRRIDRAIGILSMYECDPKDEKEPAHA